MAEQSTPSALLKWQLDGKRAKHTWGLTARQPEACLTSAELQKDAVVCCVGGGRPLGTAQALLCMSFLLQLCT